MKSVIIRSIFIMIAVISGCGSMNYQKSDHCDGSVFFSEESGDDTFTDMMKWMWEMKTVDWPEWIDDPPQPKPESRIGGNRIKITFINHATVLIQMDDINILTDPIWSERAGPFSWAGTKRIRKPGVDFDKLPRIDIVLISHNHYDHLDLSTLVMLDEKFHPVFLTGLGNSSLLDSAGIVNVEEMDWWGTYDKKVDKKITFVPARHNSGRGLFDKNKSLWGGFVIEGPSGKVYFAGDTAYGKFLDDIARKFNNFRLTIFPIGSYEKRWFMKNQHMSPEDAVKAHILLKSGQSIGMHYATFNEHPEQRVDDHVKDLESALKSYSVDPAAFWILGFGEGRFVK